MSSLLHRLQGSLPGRFAKAYGDSKAGNYAAGLAFNSFTSMFPLLLGLLTIAGLVFGGQQRAHVQAVLVGAFPAEAQAAMRTALTNAQQHAGLFGLAAILGLIWTGTNFFGSMEFALSEMFGVQQRTFLRQRLMGLLMLVVFLVGMGVAVIANTALGFLRISFLGPVLGALVLVGLMTVVYRVVPNRSFGFVEVLRGSVLAGIGIEIVTLLFPFYAHLMHGFSSYGATFALFLLLAAWLYLVSQLILMGAVLTRMLLGAPREEGVVAEPNAKHEQTRGSAAAERQGQPGGS
jgi:membrane protein